VRELGAEIADLFTQVLLNCDTQGLIGRHMFAIDGIKLPSNASKSRRPKPTMGIPKGSHCRSATHRKVSKEAQHIHEFLATNAERKNPKGQALKRNVTDNESAKMATAKGIIQGYTAIAVVDNRHQIIVAAKAHDSGSEQTAYRHRQNKFNCEQMLQLLFGQVASLGADTVIGLSSGDSFSDKFSYSLIEIQTRFYLKVTSRNLSKNHLHHRKTLYVMNKKALYGISRYIYLLPPVYSNSI
jgi:hypothetical protein